MSKLFKLKEWMTIPDAARYLSQILNESVCEADLLQLALDGHLKISVDFPNGAKARMGRVIPYKDVKLREMPSPLDGGKTTISYVADTPLHHIKHGEQLKPDTPFLHFEDEVVSIRGLWDLAMEGNERIDIEFDLQQLIDGPEVTMESIAGTFLNRSDGTWASLQEVSGPTFSSDGLWKNKETKKASYYPAGGLGQDCIRVIRTSEILALQEKINGTDSEKPLSTKERNTLLTIIAVLCKEAKLDHAKAAKTAGLIQSMAATMGVSIGESTIEVHLKKIPDALGTRMK